MNLSLKKAYELERKGLEFYISSAASCKNALAKKTLFTLAQEEIKHMIKIDEISLAIDNTGKWPDSETESRGSDIEMAIKEFFVKTAKELMEADRDNADIIKKAMEFERKSYDLYDDLSEKAASGPEKQFYNELKAQENQHYAALENVYYYLAHSGDWFEKEESKAWNWMNS